MAFVTADRVLDSSTSTGTGAFVVSGTPAAGYRTFSAVMSVGDTCYYSIQGQTTSEWEVGLGTYSSANTLTRTTIYSSSNAGAAVTFSAGTKNVFITMAASRAPQLDPSGNVTALGTPASISLANATSLPLATGVTGTLSANNGGSVAWQTVQTASFTAVAGNAYPVNTTSAAITVTLPASPSAGNIVQLTDYAGTWATNNVTVAPNGAKITGSTSNSVLAVAGSSLALVYIDATQGWIPFSAFKTLYSGQPYNVSYLVVAGGGGGAGGNGGAGGGAGGFLASTASFAIGTTYTVTVGAGGTNGGTSGGALGTSGGNSSISSISVTAVGGGYGGSRVSGSETGASGGSGGGSSSSGSTVAGGSGTSGQGFAGGSGNNTTTYPVGGGGGGASAVGANSIAGVAGAGGAGSASSITGSSVTYGGGGGGAPDSRATAATAGSGGSGGGGAGSSTSSGTSGTVNTGGGGGGGGFTTGPTTFYAGGAGGSGVVILSVPTVNYTGTTTGSPTVTTLGANTILKFIASGSYTA